jgi:ABC-type protease/lipase transport system fused ATPase/permease subunit
MAMPEVAAMPATVTTATVTTATVTTATVTTAMTAAAMTAAATTAAAVTAALGLCSHVSRRHHQARHAPTVARQYTPTRAPVANRPVKNLRALFCPFPVISFHLSVL